MKVGQLVLAPAYLPKEPKVLGIIFKIEGDNATILSKNLAYKDETVPSYGYQKLKELEVYTGRAESLQALYIQEIMRLEGKDQKAGYRRSRRSKTKKYRRSKSRK
jgi:hypothetical protein